MESVAVAVQPINNSIDTKIYATFSQYITKPLPLGSSVRPFSRNFTEGRSEMACGRGKYLRK